MSIGPIKAFHERHAPNADSIGKNGWIYYPDGAVCEARAGTQIEPLKNSLEHWENITMFHRCWLEREVETFDKLREQLFHFASEYNDPADLEKLKELQRVVLNRKTKLRNAELEFEKTKPGYLTPVEARRKQQEDEQGEAARIIFKDAVKAIEV